MNGNAAYAYAVAVAQERAAARRYAELARYVRTEYGPGTDVEYLLASANGSTAPKRGPNGNPLRALVRAVRTLFANGRGKPSTPSVVE